MEKDAYGDGYKDGERDTRLVTIKSTRGMVLPDETTVKTALDSINRFQKVVHANMIPNVDYGIIPGTQKPTLLKPGAEKIVKLLNLSDEYCVMERTEQWQGPGFPLFRYMVKCILRNMDTGTLVSEGMGECNSYEAKYRYREGKRHCPECGSDAIIKGKAEYGGGWLCFNKKGGCGAKFPEGDKAIESQTTGRVESEDVFSQVNTILKMAKKRAQVDAALSAGRLSNVFTQDLEDIEPRPPAQPKPQAQTVTAQPAPAKAETPNPPSQEVKVSQASPDAESKPEKPVAEQWEAFYGLTGRNVDKENKAMAQFANKHGKGSTWFWKRDISRIELAQVIGVLEERARKNAKEAE